MAGWDPDEDTAIAAGTTGPDVQAAQDATDLGNQPDVGDPGEYGYGYDYRGSPLGMSEKDGSYDWGSDQRDPSTDRHFLEQAREKKSASKGGLQAVWDKQTGQWKEYPGRKLAVSGTGTFIAAKAGLGGGPPGFFIGLGLDMLANALGLYGPTYPTGIGDTKSWYGNNPPPTPDDPFGGEGQDLPQPKKKKVPRPIYSAGSGNKPELMIARGPTRAAKRQITRRV